MLNYMKLGKIKAIFWIGNDSHIRPLNGQIKSLNHNTGHMLKFV